MEQRFWDKVTKKDSGCWEFEIASNSKTVIYGTYKGKRAHRVSWEMVNGPIPEGMIICHKCDNPPCVNPDHLFVGTHRDNFNDMVSKNRQAFRVLTEEEKREIYSLYYGYTGLRQRHLAEYFNVSLDAIKRVTRGRYEFKKVDDEIKQKLKAIKDSEYAISSIKRSLKNRDAWKKKGPVQRIDGKYVPVNEKR